VPPAADVHHRVRNGRPALFRHAIPAAVAHPEIDEQASGTFAIAGVQGSTGCRDRVADAISPVRGGLLVVDDGKECRLVQHEAANPLACRSAAMRATAAP
jgi:hypothetical protein